MIIGVLEGMTSNGYPLFHYISFILYPPPASHEIHSQNNC